MIKELFHQKDMAILNVYALNYWIAKYMKQKLTGLKREIDKFTNIVEDFNTPALSVDRKLDRRSTRI